MRRARRRAGPILDRNGRVLVDNVAGTAREALVGRPAQATGRYASIKHLADVLTCRSPRLAKRSTSAAATRSTRSTVKTAVGEDQVTYLYEHSSEFPGVLIEQTYVRHYPYQSLAAQVLGYVGEIVAGRARASKQRLQAGRQGRPDRRRVDVRRVPPRRRRAGRVRVDSLGRPQGPLQLRRAAQPGKAVRLTIDVGLQRAAEQALAVRDPSARRRTSRTAPTAARSSRSTRTTARCSRWRRPRRTSRRSTSGASTRRSSSRSVNDKAAKEKNYPGLNRVIERRVPARLDLQAGHRARGDAGAPAPAVRRRSSARRPRRTASTSRSSTTGTRTSTSRWTWPTALAASCDTYFYQLGYQFYSRGDRGQPLQQWARRSASGRRPASTSAASRAGWCRRPSGGTEGHGKTDDWQIDRSGSRATRSSSRSASRTCR